jgi:hypothetical protein
LVQFIKNRSALASQHQSPLREFQVQADGVAQLGVEIIRRQLLEFLDSDGNIK